MGKGADKSAVHMKGQEVPVHGPRGKKGVGLAYGTSNRGACHLQTEHDDFYENEAWLRPEIGINETIDRLAADKEKARLVKILSDMWPTGWDTTVAEFIHVGERAVNICRSFNVREGFSRKDDPLPERL